MIKVTIGPAPKEAIVDEVLHNDVPPIILSIEQQWVGRWGRKSYMTSHFWLQPHELDSFIAQVALLKEGQ